MKIVQVSTVFESTPPKKYGGTERVAAKITEGLVGRGHEVYLFASGESKTKATLITTTKHPLFREEMPATDYSFYRLEHICRALEYANRIKADLIHLHELYPALSLCRLTKIPCIVTVHLSIDSGFIGEAYTKYLLDNKNLNFVSISNSQRRLPLNFVKTIYNGTTISPIGYSEKGRYAFWVGRITKDKGTDRAVKIAGKAGIKLVIAGKLEKTQNERNFFRKLIKPFIDKKHIEYVGEVNEQERNELMRGAMFFLNPIDWDEPFGLVITESMAQGTPVISFANGSPEEIITDGADGFLINEKSKNGKKFLIKQTGTRGMVAAAKKIMRMSETEYRQMSENCIRKVKKKFSDEIMVQEYEKLYEKIIKH